LRSGNEISGGPDSGAIFCSEWEFEMDIFRHDQATDPELSRASLYFARSRIRVVPGSVYRKSSGILTMRIRMVNVNATGNLLSDALCGRELASQR
jgi:hypothetical protein